MNRPHAFFHRIEGLGLYEGSKAAGFDLLVSTSALQVLVNTPVDPGVQERVVEEAKARIVRAGLLPKKVLARTGILFWKGTLVPRIFHADMAFGGSIAADPQTYEHLYGDEALARLGDEVAYTPHNVDTAKTALALVLLAQTWSEHAACRLELAAQTWVKA